MNRAVKTDLLVIAASNGENLKLAKRCVNAALQRQNTRDLEKAKAVEEPKPATEFKSRAPSFRREQLRRTATPESDATPVVAAPKE